MTIINFKLKDGSTQKINAENGLTLMEVARDNDLGIEGTCGGSISCCTCHVVVDKNWFKKVGPPNPDEEVFRTFVCCDEYQLLRLPAGHY